MKIAAYFDEDCEWQIVLTPQNDAEKALLGLLGEGDNYRGVVKRGQLYETRGGYLHHASAGYSSGPDSTFIKLLPPEETKP